MTGSAGYKEVNRGGGSAPPLHLIQLLVPIIIGIHHSAPAKLNSVGRLVDWSELVGQAQAAQSGEG